MDRRGGEDPGRSRLVGEPGRLTEAVCPEVSQGVPRPEARQVGEKQDRRAAARQTRGGRE